MADECIPGCPVHVPRFRAGNPGGGGGHSAVNLDNLTPEQCQTILQCIIDHGTPAQFEDFCAALGTLLTVSTGPDGVTANATAAETLACGDTLHLFSPDNSILFTVTDGSVIVGAQLNPTVLAGVTHTTITNIDLQPTGTPDEFTVVMEWTDGDGNPQTTTDPTPITISGGGDKVCQVTTSRFGIDFTNATVGADFGTGTVIPSINGGVSSNPGINVIQGYIDDHLDYATPDGVQTDLTVPDQQVTGQTDGGWIEFWAYVPLGETRNISWEWTGEGWARLEIDQCGNNGYVIADETYANIEGTTVTGVLPEGLHKVRVTNVDVGGNASIWAYNGDPLGDVYAGSAAPIVGQLDTVSDCDGNLTLPDGTPFVGEFVDAAVWPCAAASQETCECLTINQTSLGEFAAPSPVTPGAIGALITTTGSPIVLTPENVVGATASSDNFGFNTGDPNNPVPVRVTVERLEQGTANGPRFEPDGTAQHTVRWDHRITIDVLPDKCGVVHALPIMMSATSIQATREEIRFQPESPVLDYIHGAGIDITGQLPYTGPWHNSNSNIPGGFFFGETTSVTIHKDGDTATGFLTWSALAIPEPYEFRLCDIPALISEGTIGSAPAAAAPAVPAVPADVVICEPFELDAGFVDDFGSITRTWTPTALGEYTFDFAGGFFEPDDTGMLQVGTAGVVDNVFDGSGSLISQATPSQSLALTVTELVEHTFTFTIAGTTAFNEADDMTAIATSCPAGSLDLSAFRNVATADLVADGTHTHDFGGFRQVWDNVGEFEVRATSEGFSDGRVVLVSTADDNSNSAAVRATSSSAANGTEARIALTARDAGFDENSVRVSESGVGIRFGDSGVAGSVLTIETLPAYADQDAAIAAGAQGTTVYQTDGTGTLPAGVVMIVQ